MDLILFDVDKYRKSLKTQWLGQSIDYFEELDSTNTYLKKLEKDNVSHGQLCITDNQTKGRGQYERRWETEPGKNLTFTLVFKPSVGNRFHVLALACARAAVAQIEASFGKKAFIKWPNDVLVDNKKVAGFLTESVFSGNALDRLLVGIGLNANQDRFPGELEHKAASLKQVIGKDVDREQFLCAYLSRLEYNYMLWHKQSDDLLKSINKKIIGHGRWVDIQVDEETLPDKFKLLGIDQKGQLTAVSKEGDIETFSHEQIRLITD